MLYELREVFKRGNVGFGIDLELLRLRFDYFVDGRIIGTGVREWFRIKEKKERKNENNTLLKVWWVFFWFT